MKLSTDALLFTQPNYYALLLSILHKKSCDQSLRMMGLEKDGKEDSDINKTSYCN
jgi:hypothetical protein